MIEECPHNAENNNNASSGNTIVQFFTKEIKLTFLEQFVSETLNCAIVDSGCPHTVAGKNWMQCYMDTLPESVILEQHESKNQFKFGDVNSPVYPSPTRYNLPVTIGTTSGYIWTDIVDCEIPMLLSKDTLKRNEASLDFVNDVLVMNNEHIKLQNTSNGHYCIPVTTKSITLVAEVDQPSVNPSCRTDTVLINHKDLISANTNQKRTIAQKLHQQFGHPVDYEKLKALCSDAGIHDRELSKAIEEVTESCTTCNRFRKAKLKPVVSLPMANDFNEVLAMDLKFITVAKQHIILHMIDIFTRYSAGALVKSKDKEVIVNAILKNWIAIFGKPATIFSDNGGEFNNALLRDVAELLDCRVTTTAAYSPWSNGIVERHNAVIENMILKIMDDTGCNIENALLWSLCAKNTLHNNRGYSPNQLVFGRNPNLPSVLSCTPPALRTVTPSKLIAEHLSVLNNARKAFVESEASSKIKRALNHKTRTANSKEYINGDRVFYKRPSRKEWFGPGKIIGIDGAVVLVRHGGSVVSVNPCDLLKANEYTHNEQPSSSAESPQSVGSTPQSNDKILCTIDLMDYKHSSNWDLIDLQSSNTSVTAQNMSLPVQTPTNISNAPLDSHYFGEFDPITRSEVHFQNDSLQVLSSLNSIPSESPGMPISQKTPATGCSSSTSSQKQKLNVPQIGDKIRLVDPDTKQEGNFLVTLRSGKVKGGNKYWFNVRNMLTGEKKSLDLERIEWTVIPEEIFYNQNDSAAVLQAQNDELDKWQQYNVYDEVDDDGQFAISTRWVLTEKQVNGTQRVKARLVARGFEEENIDEIRCDSPTIKKENLRLVCAVIASHEWTLHSMDVTSAFLQGTPISRTVHLTPPDEANTTKLWKLKTPVYGLVDASRSWYLKVEKVLKEQGAVKSKYDDALFFWRKDGQLQGIMCCHVDDFLHGGTFSFIDKVIGYLKQQFSLSDECVSTFTYTGINFSQSAKCITMSQQSYIDGLQMISTDDIPPSGRFNAKQIRQVRGLVGKLQWAAKLTRPDISFSMCDLSSRAKDASIVEVKEANKLLKKLHQQQYTVVIPNIGDVTAAS